MVGALLGARPGNLRRSNPARGSRSSPGRSSPGRSSPGPIMSMRCPKIFKGNRECLAERRQRECEWASPGRRPRVGHVGRLVPGSAGPSGSPIPGMSAKDFQKMCRSVDKAFSQFARIVDAGVSEAAEALGQSPEKNLKAHKELQEKRKREKKARKAEEEARRRAAQQACGQQPYGQQWAPLSKAKKRFRSSGGLTAAGVVMTAIGGACTFAFGTFTVVGVATGLAVGPGGIITAVLFGALTVGAAGLLANGIGAPPHCLATEIGAPHHGGARGVHLRRIRRAAPRSSVRAS